MGKKYENFRKNREIIKIEEKNENLKNGKV
jgi:hypothetical protein